MNPRINGRPAPCLPELLRTALSRRKRISLPPGPVPAAVLVPLFIRDGDYHILFTKRPAHLNHHGGEFSFPGGVRHPEDRDSRETALREAWEEVGIDPARVDVLGALDDVYSVHNYLVTPYVGFYNGDLLLKLNPAEIDKVLEIPLHLLRDPERFREEDWSWRGRTQPVLFYSFGEDEVWGMTAAIVKQFLDIANADELSF